MELKNERFIEVVEYDMNLTEEETKILCDYAMEKIVHDEKALINYAVVHMLGAICNNLEDPIEKKKFLKKVKELDNAEKDDTVVVKEEPKKRGRKPKVK